MPETAAKEKEKENVEEQAGAKAEPGPEKKPNKFLKLAIMIVVLQVVMAAGAFAVVKMIVVPRALASAQKPLKKADSLGAEKKEPGEIYLIDNIIVNPAGTNGTRYLSTSIGLDFEKTEKAAEHIKAMTPAIRDILIAILSSKTLEELGSSEGKEVMRKQILDRVNQALSPEIVTKIYFVDYVLQ
jgi:flagellar protein FliL